MATTRFNLPNDLTAQSPAAGHTQINALADAVGANINKATSFTPTWTGLTHASPTVGGYYVDLGDTVWFQARYQWATTAPTIGGTVTIALPTAASTAQWNTLNGYLANGSTYLPLVAFFSGSTYEVRGVQQSTGILSSIPNAGTGVTPATSGGIQIAGIYRKA